MPCQEVAKWAGQRCAAVALHLRKRLKGLKPIDGQAPLRIWGTSETMCRLVIGEPVFAIVQAAQWALAIFAMECRRCTSEARPIHAVVPFSASSIDTSPDVGLLANPESHGFRLCCLSATSPYRATTVTNMDDGWHHRVTASKKVSPHARLGLDHFIPGPSSEIGPLGLISRPPVCDWTP